jgi:LacI family transcriptional regulator
VSSPAVTLADVAVEAGVHPSTVSRVLSRPQLIGEPTRTAVHAAIDKLGYIPNRAARQLAGGRIGAIGVLVPDITNPFFAHVVRSVQQGCRRSGLTMLLADTDQRAADELTEARALAGSVDGYVVCSPVAATEEWLQVVGDAPLVFVNRRARGVASVALDQHAIVELGVTHLRAAGIAPSLSSAAPTRTGHLASATASFADCPACSRSGQRAPTSKVASPSPPS